MELCQGKKFHNWHVKAILDIIRKNDDDHLYIIHYFNLFSTISIWWMDESTIEFV
jgi:hypothetical protein